MESLTAMENSPLLEDGVTTSSPITIPSTLPVAPVVVALRRKGIIIHILFWAWDAPADNSCVLYSLILARDFDQVSRHSPEDLIDHLESEQLSLRCTDALPSLCQSHSTEQSWSRIWSATLLNLFQEFGLEKAGNADRNAKLQQLATHPGLVPAY